MVSSALLWVCAWITWWVFLILKLGGAWASVSWWVVTAPLWGVAAITMFYLVVGCAAAAAGAVLAKSGRWNL